MFPGEKGRGNSFEISITAVEDAKGDISIRLAPATLNANGELKSIRGNTIAVTFVPHNFAKPFPRRPPAPKPGDPDDQNIYRRGAQKSG
ncbi:hypothetical protein X769_15540 [Mesorhizobium sp. LSJC268A00]|uniref:hypothetical protein n=1 Tax=unclassified Mesorhizobium TaxID=325217 RepID=UPI0003CF2624|nr:MULTISPECIES: hypothetical protein [unclassified Mesorhizobium]ESX03898.1 hypothetical protein X769_15540 [Mesorhizobium sp. LSJC268A00]ESZ06300.1 hypothetical protein X735_31265 [Mesorhizobium sp. L2C085B000]